MQVISSWQGGYRCRTAVRDFEIRVDEPIDKGGTDTGPMPTELLVASLSSCVALAVAFVARRRGIALPDVVVRADADYDGPRVARIGVEVESRHDREELASVLEEAVPLSWVANSLRGGPQLSFRIASEQPSRRARDEREGERDQEPDVTHQTPPARPER